MTVTNVMCRTRIHLRAGPSPVLKLGRFQISTSGYLPNRTVVLHTDLKDLCAQAAVATISVCVCRSTGKHSHTGQKLASLDSDLFLGALLAEAMYILFTKICINFHHSLASSCFCRQPQMMQGCSRITSNCQTANSLSTVSTNAKSLSAHSIPRPQSIIMGRGQSLLSEAFHALHTYSHTTNKQASRERERARERD